MLVEVAFESVRLVAWCNVGVTAVVVGSVGGLTGVKVELIDPTVAGVLGGGTLSRGRVVV